MCPRLLSTAVNSKLLRDKHLLLYSKCIEHEHPEILRRFKEGKTALSVCLTEEHINDIGFKLATILLMAKPKEITVLTMDGSPHCIQLHFATRQAKRLTNSKTKINHHVIEKGKVYQIEDTTIRTARHLTEIQQMKDRQQQ